MKKFIVILLIIYLILFTGCSIINDNLRIVENSNKKIQASDSGDYGGEDLDNTVSVYSERQNGMGKNATNNDGAYQNSNNLIKPRSDTRYTTLYYKDVSGILIPITRRTARIEGIAKAVLYALADTPVNREDINRAGLHPVFTSDFLINGLTIKDGIAIVDINKNIDEYMIKAMVYSLSEFDTVNSLNLLVDGYGYASADREGINTIESGEGVGLGNNNDEEVEVYFTKLVENKYLYYVPVSRKISNSAGDTDRYLKTINELIKGEGESTRLKSYVPQKTVLKGIQVDGQTVILDFNDTILNADTSSSGFDIMLKQILLCFKQFGKVKKVKITVNGKALQLPGEYSGKEALDVPIYANIL